ncbi:MAG: hypothetical protein ACYDGX_10165 [Thermoleophilia bacterium]
MGESKHNVGGNVPRQKRHETKFPGIIYYKTMYRCTVTNEVTDWEEPEDNYDCARFMDCPGFSSQCESCEDWNTYLLKGDRETILKSALVTEYTYHIRYQGKEPRIGGNAWEGMTPKKANQILVLRKSVANGLLSEKEANAKELHLLTMDFPRSVNALWLEHRMKRTAVQDFKKEVRIFRQEIMPLIGTFLFSPFYGGEREVPVDHVPCAPTPFNLIEMFAFQNMSKGRREKAMMLLAKMMGLYWNENESDMVLAPRPFSRTI